ncbi:hypothetical protein [Hyunsoonleella rubra]|uniref:Outer membrane protein beta-barrel domain-containing protein n=1 Tax=Hyunsoonleella rubra TaxID=1737062 RepID=A0ABW5TFC9_9FLAO
MQNLYHKIGFGISFFILFNLTAQEKTMLIPDNSDLITVQKKDGNPEDLSVENAKSKYGVINENVSFGLSLGYNISTETIQTAQISPIDNTLIVDEAQKGSFVLSTVISVPLLYKEKTFRYLDKDGQEIGQLHTTSGLSLIGIVNLVTLSEAQTGSIFNQKISGGLGISYNFDRNVAIGLAYELISYRKPKDFLLNLKDSEIMENGTSISSIDTSDNTYYFDRYAGTLSLKLIYKLTKK